MGEPTAAPEASAGVSDADSSRALELVGWDSSRGSVGEVVGSSDGSSGITSSGVVSVGVSTSTVHLRT